LSSSLHFPISAFDTKTHDAKIPPENQKPDRLQNCNQKSGSQVNIQPHQHPHQRPSLLPAFSRTIITTFSSWCSCWESGNRGLAPTSRLFSSPSSAVSGQTSTSCRRVLQLWGWAVPQAQPPQGSGPSPLGLQSLVSLRAA